MLNIKWGWPLVACGYHDGEGPASLRLDSRQERQESYQVGHYVDMRESAAAIMNL